MKLLLAVALLVFNIKNGYTQDIGGRWFTLRDQFRQVSLDITATSNNEYSGYSTTIVYGGNYVDLLHNDTLIASLRGYYSKEENKIYLEEYDIIKGDKNRYRSYEAFELVHIKKRKKTFLKGRSYVVNPGSDEVTAYDDKLVFYKAK